MNSNQRGIVIIVVTLALTAILMYWSFAPMLRSVYLDIKGDQKYTQMFPLNKRNSYFNDHKTEFNNLIELGVTKGIQRVTNDPYAIESKKSSEYTLISGYYIFPKKPKSDYIEIIGLVKKLDLDGFSIYSNDNNRIVVDLLYGRSLGTLGWIYFSNVPGETEKKYYVLDAITDHWCTYVYH